MALGYVPDNPPLYTWAVWTLEPVTGAGVLTHSLLRFGALALFYLGLWAAARRAGCRPGAALAAPALASLVPVLGWDALQLYTDTLFAVAACALACWAALRLPDADRIGGPLLLGLALAAAMLSKHGAVPVAVGLLVGLAIWAPSRRRLRDPIALIALLAPMALATPHWLWLVDHQHLGRWTVSAASAGGTLAGWSEAVKRIIGALAALLALPALALWLSRLGRAPRRQPPWRGGAAPALGAAIGGIAWPFLGVGLFPGFAVSPHHLAPAVAPLAVLGAIAVARTDDRAWRRLTLGTAAVAVGVAATLAAKIVSEPDWCRRCYLHVPAEIFAAEIKARGLDGGTILVEDTVTAGQLRPFLPDTRLLARNLRVEAPPGSPWPAAVAWIEDPALHQPAPSEQRLWNVLRARVGVDPAQITREAPVDARLRFSRRILRLNLVSGRAAP